MPTSLPTRIKPRPRTLEYETWALELLLLAVLGLTTFAWVGILISLASRLL
ncbi:hypothetical protein SAMN05519103_09544 [Rhizobiales bacterium GAS113]|nr:hypothetical protein SAMN05519103_09544 [Rhizobiales bacterium GAS113]